MYVFRCVYVCSSPRFCIVQCVYIQWILSTIDYLSNHRNVTADHTRVWIAKVIMALVTIMRKTEVLIPSDSNALKIMLSSLSLEKSLCTDVVIKMEGSLR